MNNDDKMTLKVSSHHTTIDILPCTHGITQSTVANVESQFYCLHHDIGIITHFLTNDYKACPLAISSADVKTIHLPVKHQVRPIFFSLGHWSSKCGIRRLPMGFRPKRHVHWGLLQLSLACHCSVLFFLPAGCPSDKIKVSPTVYHNGFATNVAGLFSIVHHHLYD